MREGIQKTYEVRAVVFQFLESTRSGTPRDPWMKGEPTPAWDHGTRGSSPFWLGEGRVPGGNVATPEIVVFGVGEPGFLQAGRGSAVGKHAQSTTATPLRSFLKFSQSLRRPPTVATMAQGSRANQLTGSIPSPTWSEKVHPHLPLGGDLREGTWYCRTRGNILELEAALSTVFATFLNSNLSFSMVCATF